MSYLDNTGLETLVNQIKTNFVTNTSLSNSLQNYFKKNGDNAVLYSSGNLNDFITGIGVFQNNVSGGSGSITNAPEPTSSYSWLIISAGEINQLVIQLAFNLNTQMAPRMRIYSSGSWDGWEIFGTDTLNIGGSQYMLRTGTSGAAGYITFVTGS